MSSMRVLFVWRACLRSCQMTILLLQTFGDCNTYLYIGNSIYSLDKINKNTNNVTYVFFLSTSTCFCTVYLHRLSPHDTGTETHVGPLFTMHVLVFATYADIYLKIKEKNPSFTTTPVTMQD